MNLILPPEDCPPNVTTDLDATMRRQLELSTRQYFFEACDGSIQALLMECRWIISISEVLMLVIHCPNAIINWRVLNQMATLAEPLAQFSPLAKIRVYPPAGRGGPFDMRVNERSEYHEGQEAA